MRFTCHSWAFQVVWGQCLSAWVGWGCFFFPVSDSLFFPPDPSAGVCGSGCGTCPFRLTAFRTVSSVSGLPSCFSPAFFMARLPLPMLLPGRSAPRLAVSVASSTPWPRGPSPQFRQALALSPPQGRGASPTPGCPPLRISWWGQGATVWVGSSCASVGCRGFAGRGPVWHAALPPCCAAPLAAIVTSSCS